MCKNATQFFWGIGLISFFFYIKIYLSIACPCSYTYTAKFVLDLFEIQKASFIMMGLICQRLLNTNTHTWRKNYWTQFTFVLKE